MCRAKLRSGKVKNNRIPIVSNVIEEPNRISPEGGKVLSSDVRNETASMGADRFEIIPVGISQWTQFGQ